MKMYGLINNRFEEGKQYEDLKIGTDITMYLYSDRRCYYVTDVIDDKHIKVRPYFVCADHDKKGGQGHQNWVYFKTLKEEVEYLNAHGFDREYDPRCESIEEEWTYRYNKWMQKVICTVNPYTKKEIKDMNTKGYFERYFDLSGQISIGIRDYHWDWEF